METGVSMHKPSRATDPLISVGYKHSAEGAGGASKPRWFPLPKTRMGDYSLHFWEEKNSQCFRGVASGHDCLPRPLMARDLLAQKVLG
jgi:hypothetical protein